MRSMTVFVLTLCAVWYFSSDSPIQLEPGVKAPDEPVQIATESATPFEHLGYLITPLADFTIQAKVLARETYYFDREAELSPVDLALGWGAMSDQQIIDQIEVRQSGRWYRWSAKKPPIAKRDIETHSANMHLIPANDAIGSALSGITPGQIIRIHGYLVSVKASDGWRWSSSLTRSDTGPGACELIFVTSVTITDT